MYHSLQGKPARAVAVAAVTFIVTVSDRWTNRCYCITYSILFKQLSLNKYHRYSSYSSHRLTVGLRCSWRDPEPLKLPLALPVALPLPALSNTTTPPIASGPYAGGGLDGGAAAQAIYRQQWHLDVTSANVEVLILATQHQIVL